MILSLVSIALVPTNTVDGFILVGTNFRKLKKNQLFVGV